MSAWRPERLTPRHTATVAVFLALAGTLLLPAAASGSGGWQWPVEGEVVTPYDFGDDPYAAGQHRGIDISAPAGEAVRAATAGTVTFSGGAASSGLTVSILTADGRFQTAYLHLDSISADEGDRVEAGGELGTVGTTGKRSADAPHLHFGVRDAGERHGYRDPLLFLEPPPAPVPPLAPLPGARKPDSLRQPARPPLTGPAPVAAPKGAAVPELAAPAEPSPAGSGRPGAAPDRAVARPPSRELADPRRSPALAAAGDASRAPGLRFDLGWAIAFGAVALAGAALTRVGRSGGRARPTGCRPLPARRE